MRVRTCTKVNIGLNVLRRRPDGYHDLETLFVPYWGLGDILEIEPAESLSIEIERDGGVDWDPMEDLTVRAWRLLKADFSGLTPVSIRLQKGAPVGAGLGGGSADAAFMLRGLNELGSLGLSDASLASYAARLGSDCAFFVGTKGLDTTSVASAPYFIGPKFATGRGEILEPFDIDLSPYDLRVEIPLDASGRPVAVSTREAYGGIVPRDTRQAAPIDFVAVGTVHADTVPLREALRLPVEQWRGIVVNDFEATVCPRHPEIQTKIDDFYRRGAVYAAMSGSGSAVFGLFPRN